MESHEENLHNMIKISKMETAKDQARDAARTIRDRRLQQQRSGVPTGMGGGGGEGNDMQLGLKSHSFQFQFQFQFRTYFSTTHFVSIDALTSAFTTYDNDEKECSCIS